MSDLVVRARTDRQAFGQLYDRYYPTVFRYCLRRLFVRAAAEDVTSEVFLRVAAHIGRFEGTTEDDFRRWIYRIATNEVNAHLRRTKRRKRLWDAAARAKALPAPVDHSADGLDALDWPTVYQAILSLKPREQSIIALRFFEGMPYEQIAVVLGQRPGTVRVALSRALEKVRRRLGVFGDRRKADAAD
ncbi:MAG: RNA polymerase sigma factor [Planctomycetota bacterium]|jgi:RNA polymerase sigma-70 factor (ECF subfamily)